MKQNYKHTNTNLKLQFKQYIANIDLATITKNKNIHISIHLEHLYTSVISLFNPSSSSSPASSSPPGLKRRSELTHISNNTMQRFPQEQWQHENKNQFLPRNLNNYNFLYFDILSYLSLIWTGSCITRKNNFKLLIQI